MIEQLPGVADFSYEIERRAERASQFHSRIKQCPAAASLPSSKCGSSTHFSKRFKIKIVQL
jgi:hypothetical protein